jgi:hypothetical protein
MYVRGYDMKCAFSVLIPAVSEELIVPLKTLICGSVREIDPGKGCSWEKIILSDHSGDTENRLFPLAMRIEAKSNVHLPSCAVFEVRLGPKYP